MPRGGAAGRMHGFQLWANLPSALKMTAPRYQDIEGSDITEVVDDDGTVVKIIIGRSGASAGRSTGSRRSRSISTSRCPRASAGRLPVDTRANAFAYVFAGSGTFRDAAAPRGVRVEKEFRGEELNIRDLSGNRTLVRFGSATR